MPLDSFLLHAEAGDLAAIQAISEADLPKKLRLKDEDARTALHRACAGGHHAVVEYLVRSGADVNTEDDEGWTPLHSCASKGDSALVDMLLERNADPDAATSSKAVALHLAASKGHMDVLRSLLAANAKKGSRDRQGATPFLRAASAGKAEALQALLDAKSDAAARDRFDENAMHMAINGHHVACCEILMACDDAEAMMSRENKEGKTPATALVELLPIEVRDTLKSIWREKRGG
mmetsp:Transcript_78221/g.135668  ORF Transcript_78221/g.135668 Transcript_78221/m.135668 type:complete len:235 (-) Transcript_78221:22-726(-)